MKPIYECIYNIFVSSLSDLNILSVENIYLMYNYISRQFNRGMQSYELRRQTFKYVYFIIV